MKTYNKNQNVADFGHVAIVSAKAHAITPHGLYAYLASFADVAIALMILVSICSSSLLVLCTSLGVI